MGGYLRKRGKIYRHCQQLHGATYAETETGEETIPSKKPSYLIACLSRTAGQSVQESGRGLKMRHATTTMRAPAAAIASASASADAAMRSNSSSYQESVMKQKLKLAGLDMSQVNNNIAGVIGIDQSVLSPKFTKSPKSAMQQQQLQAQAVQVSPRSAPIRYHEAVAFQRTKTTRLDLNLLSLDSPISFPASVSSTALAPKSVEQEFCATSPNEDQTPRSVKYTPVKTPRNIPLDPKTPMSAASKIKILSHVGSVHATYSPFKFSPRASSGIHGSNSSGAIERLNSMALSMTLVDNVPITATSPTPPVVVSIAPKVGMNDVGCARFPSDSSCTSNESNASFRSVPLEPHQVSQYYGRCRRTSNSELAPIMESIVEDEDDEESGDDSIFESENPFVEVEGRGLDGQH